MRKTGNQTSDSSKQSVNSYNGELRDAIVITNSGTGKDIKYINIQDTNNKSEEFQLSVGSWVRVLVSVGSGVNLPKTTRMVIIHDPNYAENDGQLAEVANTLQITLFPPAKVEIGVHPRLIKLRKNKKKIKEYIEKQLK